MSMSTGQLTHDNQAWLSDLAHTLGFADVSHVIEMQGFVLQDIGFFFYENDPVTPDSLWVQCLMGDVPDDDLGPALTRLLQMQLLTQGRNGPLFGVDPTGKHLIVSTLMHPNQFDTTQHLFILHSLVELVQSWQADKLSTSNTASNGVSLATSVSSSSAHESAETRIKA